MSMDLDSLNKIQHNEAVRKRLAKWMAQFSFRNTKLEDFHDRFNDEEMKTLMIDVVNHSYTFLSILFCTDNSNTLIELLNEKDEVPEWNDPEISDELIENAKQVLKLLELHRNAA